MLVSGRRDSEGQRQDYGACVSIRWCNRALGVPSRNGAEIIIDAFDAENLPTSYRFKGFTGEAACVEFVDGAGGLQKPLRWPARRW